MPPTRGHGWLSSHLNALVKAACHGIECMAVPPTSLQRSAFGQPFRRAPSGPRKLDGGPRDMAQRNAACAWIAHALRLFVEPQQPVRAGADPELCAWFVTCVQYGCLSGQA